ncbi:hypothetical protein H696_05513 [Fonticula alba]|uniref:Proteasome maturation protein n=1 Tax=Fonticula alba TaxID=691883 RepID=A0A058Z3G9_FONAL|nr:hypothetical protein H696_05513 [Fonticula alba]KCV68047.1 hypothetical protein H696_05513 [Fonticula alba]|eukprot:XP_009497614.1 hypothetical protein H696_05513 [Fonticula alba]
MDFALHPSASSTSSASSVSTPLCGTQGVRDPLREGRGLGHATGETMAPRNAVVASHPMEPVATQAAALEDARRMAVLRGTQGLNAPIMYQMERQWATSLASNRAGLAGVHGLSSNLAFDVLTGRDTDLDVQDVYGVIDVPRAPISVHAQMEERLHMRF